LSLPFRRNASNLVALLGRYGFFFAGCGMAVRGKSFASTGAPAFTRSRRNSAKSFWSKRLKSIPKKQFAPKLRVCVLAPTVILAFGLQCKYGSLKRVLFVARADCIEDLRGGPRKKLCQWFSQLWFEGLTEGGNIDTNNFGNRLPGIVNYRQRLHHATLLIGRLEGWPTAFVFLFFAGNWRFAL
jgi:hypothetical protein